MRDPGAKAQRPYTDGGRTCPEEETREWTSCPLLNLIERREGAQVLRNLEKRTAETARSEEDTPLKEYLIRTNSAVKHRKVGHLTSRICPIHLYGSNPDPPSDTPELPRQYFWPVSN
ncbi:hypothetical protein AVEN_46050-1 [Araneus ventricosus]|uniref:Uncharacterized protein n=1 Tax=Araneus ventricosus TaxID=182803 RepID=A0A4Y2NJU0_ARAVE|nr:hypothetical protein AVEN_46050-1 [Araneus ventricosus]